MKRILASILAVMLLPMSALPVFGAEGVLGKNIVFDAPINIDLMAQVGELTGTNLSVYTDANRGDVICADSLSSVATMEIRTSEAQECEATVISMDASFDRTTARAYMDIFDGLSGSTNANLIPRGWYITPEGTISYFESFMPPTGTRDQSYMRYEANKWYHLDLWIDYRDMKAYYFVDGIEIGCVPFDTNPKSVRGFRMTVDRTGGGAKYYFDNVKVVNFTERGAGLGMNDIIGIPEGFSDPVITEYDTHDNNLGFIFTDKDVVLKGAVKNNRNETRKVTVKTTITDESNNIIDERSATKTLEPLQREEYSILVNVEKFGFYYLNTIVSDSATGATLYEKKFQFSVANAPSGVMNEKFGFADHTADGHGTVEMERKIKQMADIGVKTIRAEFNKHTTNYTSGTYELDASHKKLVEFASENDMDLIAILTYGKVPPVTEEEYTEWAKYVTAVVQQLKGKFENITYEVWNEYNCAGFNYIGATTTDYVNLLKATYPAVKAADENAKVAGFAVSPGNIEDNPEVITIDAIDWVEEVLQKGGGDYMDSASIHIYTHKYPEKTDIKRGKFLGEVRELLKKYGYGDMKIDITEIGWTTDGVVSERKLADWIVRWMILNYTEYDRVCWYVNQEKQTTSDFENLYGFTRAWSKQYAGEYPMYAAKYGYLSAANYNTQMSGAEIVEICETGESNTYNYRFKDAADNNLHVAWKRDSAAVREIAIEAENVSVVDVFGNPYPYEKTENGISLTLSASPVYIRETGGEPTFDVYIDYNKETVTVSGYTKGSGDRVGISVIGVEQDQLKPAILAYIGQTTADSFGKYSFTFKKSISSGKYMVKAGFDNGVLSKEVDFALNIPTLKLTANGTEIDDISQLKAGDEIKATWSGFSEILSDNDALAAVAMYEGNVLKKIKTQPVAKGESGTEISIPFEANMDCIKIIFWNANTYRPITAIKKID